MEKLCVETVSVTKTATSLGMWNSIQRHRKPTAAGKKALSKQYLDNFNSIIFIFRPNEFCDLKNIL